MTGRHLRFIVPGAAALAVLPPVLFRADEWMGYIVLVFASPLTVAAPLATASYVLAGREDFRAAHYAGAFLLLVANLMLLFTGTWGFVLTSCWNCSWPFPVAKALIASNVLVVAGIVLHGLRAGTGSDRPSTLR
jgi:hypothetical protein